ncbi:MAG: ferredoxin--NADP reductase [Acidimicrobiales bacterium]
MGLPALTSPGGTADLGSDTDQARWLAADQAAMWEVASVVAVGRGAASTTLRLRLAEPPDVLPGQYYLVRLAIEAPPFVIEQAYSLCSSPYPPSAEIEIVVRPVPGGRASTTLARRVEPGDRLQMRGPFGFLTWTESDGGPVGLVGAGSGVAPLASIVGYAAARHLEVPMTLLCSSRDRGTVLLGEQLRELNHRHDWLTVVHTFTRSPHDPSAAHHRRIDLDMLAEVMARTKGRIGEGPFYVAGPADMVSSVRGALGDLGVPDAAIYSEDHAWTTGR